MVRFLSDDPVKQDVTSKDGLEVIAAGLSRCATSLLQSALGNDLGIGPCMHMAYIALHADLLKICYTGELETDKEKCQKPLHQLCDGYATTADFPGMTFVDDLMEMYPSTKVVLNKCDSAKR
jgi:hypothetical protein